MMASNKNAPVNRHPMKGAYDDQGWYSARNRLISPDLFAIRFDPRSGCGC